FTRHSPRHHGKEPERVGRGGSPKEVGAPASGIGSRLSANALTPRYGDLKSGTWARDHPSSGKRYPITAASCSGRRYDGVFYPCRSVAPGASDNLVGGVVA